jgi:hypothetical protein
LYISRQVVYFKQVVYFEQVVYKLEQVVYFKRKVVYIIQVFNIKENKYYKQELVPIIPLSNIVRFGMPYVLVDKIVLNLTALTCKVKSFPCHILLGEKSARLAGLV